jgi:uncharacterized protein
MRTTIPPAVLREDSEDIGRNPTDNPTLGDVIAARFARRDVLKGALGVAAIATAVSPLALVAAGSARGETASRYRFDELEAGADDNHHVAPGYDADILIRWGDPVLPGAPPFNPSAHTGAAQRLQFGYNNDFLAYFPMPDASNPSAHGLLVVNHEYTNEELMFAGLSRPESKTAPRTGSTLARTDIEIAAHGGSVIEVKRENGKWQVVAGSKYARRIDANTPMEITGPAAGHPRLQTPPDPAGRRVNGMFNNCAGGVTPWGTWLTCEENVHHYFTGKLTDGHSEAINHQRYGVPSGFYQWGDFYDRFDLGKSPTEPNRFGWVVEIDPFDPASTPKKRTALGRAKHEGAAGVVNKDGRYVIYMGDDERFEYVYRFVTAGRFDAANPQASRDILDDGTVSVARFNADGTLDWLPLVHGQGPLTADNGFADQADVLIEKRRAADLLKPTRMDRPEDVEASPTTGKVYVMLTNNGNRTAAQVDAANPRAGNHFGHIIEMTPPDGDHAASQFRWEILVRCGDPSIAEVGATFSSATTRNGWFGMPDNLAFDNQGRMWIATDGNTRKRTGRTDGLWALETEGAMRGTSRHFYRVPLGAEVCGPCFTPDDETLFVAVQHPAEGGSADAISTFEEPITRWPDFKPDMPPRPSLVVITKRGGGKIAS